jgi:WD40 repeat protein
VLVSASGDDTLKVWDASNWGRKIATLSGHSGSV